jgi:hypothetical protein
MKQVCLGFLLLSLSQVLSAQILQGRVLDAETQEPIPLASVFFDGTFVGTSTDEQGNFKLNAGKYLSRPLSISAIGYSPYSLENLDPGKSFTVLLARDLYEIEEASVIGNAIAKKRKAYMRIFKSEFIGLTPNARRCYILNEEDITFNYDTDQDTLRARALKPIEIHNDALGYHLEYHLESFEFVKETQKVSYQGSIVFTYDLAWEGNRSKVFKRRRQYAYTGSGKEFIRILWQNNLKSSGYSIRNYSTGEVLKYKDVVLQDSLGRKYLKYPGNLEILYYNYFSRISFLKEEAFIDRDGFFDPTAIMWSGKMASQRIADFLPYEYSFGR